MGAVRLVTKSEYARMRGVSEAAVRKAVKDGRITLIDGKIDPSVADIQWQQNSRPRVGSRSSSTIRSSGPGASRPAESEQGNDPGDAQDRDGAPAPGGHFDYEKSRAAREHHEALMAEMRYLERSQQLCETSRVELAMADIARVMVDGLERIPDRVSVQIHTGMTHAEINSRIEQEVRAIREDLRAAIADLPRRLQE